MPCRDYYDDHPGAYFRDVTEPALKKQISFAESALCAALSALERVDSLVPALGEKHSDFYDWLDFKSAGITKSDLVKWHKKHKKLDATHRELERLTKVKKAALAKLSEEERQVLGIKK